MSRRGANILALGPKHPRIDPAAWVAPGATVIGDVLLSERASVWYGAVVRGDDETISIGADSNVQDGSVLHADPGFALRIGEGVTVGHRAVLHGCTIGRHCLIGMGAVVPNGCSIGEGSIVASGAVLREGTVVPAGSLVVGIPAAVKRDLGPAERSLIEESWREYTEKAALHRRDVTVVD